MMFSDRLRTVDLHIKHDHLRCLRGFVGEPGHATYDYDLLHALWPEQIDYLEISHLF